MDGYSIIGLVACIGLIVGAMVWVNKPLATVPPVSNPWTSTSKSLPDCWLTVEVRGLPHQFKGWPVTRCYVIEEKEHWVSATNPEVEFGLINTEWRYIVDAPVP